MEETKIKCVVWDLDNTIWAGTLIENDKVTIKDHIANIIHEIDSRGILQSISSKNEFEMARKKLEELKLWDYFIYPQINWNAKSESVTKIAKEINIGLDTLLFIDDQAFEREEVRYSCPEVECFDVNDIEKLLGNSRLTPKFITVDSHKRRQMYQDDIVRNSIEREFVGTKEDFLATLGMELKIAKAEENDLQRVEELTIRTSQLNSTGYVYSYEELTSFIYDDGYELLVVQLDDKYGSYGKIGLVVIEKNEYLWEIKLLLMSCRVMSKGLGNIILNLIINRAIGEKVKLLAQFKPTKRNRIMYITYKLNGFREIENKNEEILLLEADLSKVREIPKYVKVEGEDY